VRRGRERGQRGDRRLPLSSSSPQRPRPSPSREKPRTRAKTRDPAALGGKWAARVGRRGFKVLRLGQSGGRRRGEERRGGRSSPLLLHPRLRRSAADRRGPRARLLCRRMGRCGPAPRHRRTRRPGQARRAGRRETAAGLCFLDAGSPHSAARKERAREVAPAWGSRERGKERHQRPGFCVRKRKRQGGWGEGDGLVEPATAGAVATVAAVAAVAAAAPLVPRCATLNHHAGLFMFHSLSKLRSSSSARR
jgi:hypothetical protein